MADNEAMRVRYEKAIPALMSEFSHRAAAEKIGVHEATLIQWLKDPVLAELYSEARRAAIQHSIAQLSKMTSKATMRLFAIIMDDDQPVTAHLAAIKLVYEYAFRAEEVLSEMQAARRAEARDRRHRTHETG